MGNTLIICFGNDIPLETETLIFKLKNFVNAYNNINLDHIGFKKIFDANQYIFDQKIKYYSEKNYHERYDNLILIETCLSAANSSKIMDYFQCFKNVVLISNSDQHEKFNHQDFNNLNKKLRFD